MSGEESRLLKMNKAARDIIIKAIGKGVPRSRAAALANVTVWAIYKWMARGKKEAAEEGSEYFQFFQAVKKAEAQFIQRNLSAIETAGRKSWPARAWLLERRFPDEFGLQRQEMAALKKELANLLKALESQNGSPSGDVGSAGAG